MPTKKNQESSSSTSCVGGVLLLVVIGLGALVLYQYRDNIRLPSLSLPKTTKQAPTPTPTPTALKQGKEVYTISQASNTTGPRISKAEIDPLEPKVGEKQTIVISASFARPVSAVTISVKTDNKVTPLTLTLSGGTATDGQWKTEWTVEDSLLYTYIMTITADSGGASSKVDVAIRS